jgi:3-dehydroquinate dehydratase
LSLKDVAADDGGNHHEEAADQSPVQVSDVGINAGEAFAHLRFRVREALVDLLVEVVEALVGSLLSRHHHRHDHSVTF